MNYHVSVRSLVEFTARRGDLDLRFTPAPTPEEGVLGHQIIAKRRPVHYESEVRLSGSYPGLDVSGRADGYDPIDNCVEEVKTYRSTLERIPENQRFVHIAQAKIYAWLLCQSRGLTDITVAVVYYHIITGEEDSQPETFTCEVLERFFNQHCEAFLCWAEAETAHRKRRNISLQALDFPHKNYRIGQKTLANEVYRAARDQRVLLAQATTGIGKTLATLFPQLRAMGEYNTDRVFFLTAKTPGRQLALDALHTLRRNSYDLQLRVLEYVARDKACLHKDKVCHGESCPLAKGFYDRLPAAREAAANQRWLNHDAIQTLASEHTICPYYLSQEMAKWSDVFVGDYNYYFDMSALMFALTIINEWRVTLLVDEAHNLVDRARSMYTASLDSAALVAARQAAPSKLGRHFQRVSDEWHRAFRDQTDSYKRYDMLPSDLLKALQRLVSELTDLLSEKPNGLPAELMTYYFNALLFLRLSESFGDHSLFDVVVADPTNTLTASALTLRNILPAKFLENRFNSAVSATLFSATLSPTAYFQDLLGLPESTQAIDVTSPFTSDQLTVRIAHDISTRFLDRPQSIAPICDCIARQFSQQPGNYLAFFSSYRYLDAVLHELKQRHPELPLRAQQSGMNEAERQSFLDSFTEDSQQIGFCVLGGAFGEGIDLPGKRLIGAFITTLGLPARNDINQEIERRMDARFGRGFDYAYYYPGLQKVVQAAGRVIRTEHDSGVIYLLDERYARPQALALLPSWWAISGLPTLPTER